ncbi:MAG: hypothetical protein HPY76_02585 [Anaerolineae bacterium]|nr:hypothetical protein [Anaerolineae bacterium]
MRLKINFLIAIVILCMAALACNFTSPSSGGDTGLEETRIALAIQQTSIAIQQMTLAAPTVPPPAATAVPPTEAPPTVVAPTIAPPEPTPVNINARIKASNILIFEDIMGYPRAGMPVVNETINLMNFSGGKIINAGDALGTFKSHANSATKWDLIIIATEVRSAFQGEMFELIYDHINRGGAVIIEAWHIDQISSGKIAPILSKCGVALQKEWPRDLTDFDPYDFSVYWLDQFHPLLTTPNTVEPPAYPNVGGFMWDVDAGDLLKLSTGGDAVLVGGLFPNRKSDYGVLTVCHGGKMVIQTFSSHDYKWSVVQPLWENYITYTLTNYYNSNP